MDGGLFLVVMLVAVAAAAFTSWYLAEQRRHALARLAASLGLAFSPHDPFDLPSLPFPLFSRGQERRASNVLHGTWEGVEVTAFDYRYVIRTQNPNGTSSRQVYRFVAALVPLPMRCPTTTIEPETLVSRIADHVGFRDIEFESEEFNRAMQVRSEDARFASYLIDARMMGWLLETKGWRFEIVNRHLLCSARRQNPTTFPLLLAEAKGFLDRIPRAARETYGVDA